MFQVPENEISLPKWSGGIAHFRNLRGHWLKKMRFVGSNASFSLMLLFRHGETTVGQGSSNSVEGNGNL